MGHLSRRSQRSSPRPLSFSCILSVCVHDLGRSPRRLVAREDDQRGLFVLSEDRLSALIHGLDPVIVWEYLPELQEKHIEDRFVPISPCPINHFVYSARTSLTGLIAITHEFHPVQTIQEVYHRGAGYLDSPYQKVIPDFPARSLVLM